MLVKNCSYNANEESVRENNCQKVYFLRCFCLGHSKLEVVSQKRLIQFDDCCFTHVMSKIETVPYVTVTEIKTVPYFAAAKLETVLCT